MDEVAEIMEAVTYTQAPVSMGTTPVGGLTVPGCCQMCEVKYKILCRIQEGPLQPHTHTRANIPITQGHLHGWLPGRGSRVLGHGGLAQSL